MVDKWPSPFSTFDSIIYTFTSFDVAGGDIELGAINSFLARSEIIVRERKNYGLVRERIREQLKIGASSNFYVARD